MRDYVFLGRIMNTNDRDRCAYIDCEYTDRLRLCGACYSGYEKEFKKKFENGNFESYLSEEQLKDLFENKNISEAIEILKSEEAEKFANKIFEDEWEYIEYNYDISNEEIKDILDYYYYSPYHLPYKDRAIISDVWNSAYDLADNENYFRLSDGRIVQLAY